MVTPKLILHYVFIKNYKYVKNHQLPSKLPNLRKLTNTLQPFPELNLPQRVEVESTK